MLCKYDSIDIPPHPHFRDGKTEAQGINKIAEIIQYLPEPIPHSSICNFSVNTLYLLHCYF